MVKPFLLIILLGVPMLCFSQSSIYSSSGEVTQNGMTMSHVIGSVANIESEDGMLSTGAMAQYSVAATTGLDLVDVTLLSVYPNPTADVFVLRTGELKNLSYTISNAEGAVIYSSTIQEEETFIDFSRYSVGVYYLSLTQEGKMVKSFSIIKK